MPKSFTARALPLAALAVACAAPPAARAAEPAWVPWRYGAPSTPRYEPYGFVTERRVLVFGGFRDRELRASDRADAYDPATDTWTRLARMPVRGTHGSVASDGATLWLVGGFVGDHPGPATTEVLTYSISQDRWREGPALPAPRAAGALVRLGRRLHYVGGLVDRTQDATAADGNHWILDLDAPERGWNPGPPLPEPRNHLAGVALDGRLYALGGRRGHSLEPSELALVHVYDPEAGTWSEAAPLLRPRSHFESAAFVHDGRIYVAGGHDLTVGSFAMDTIEVYDPAADRWSEFGRLPLPLGGAVAGVVGDTLLVAAGGVTPWVPSGHVFLRPLAPAAPGEACLPLSPFGCESLRQRLPLELDFEAEAGGLADTLGRGTGLPLALPPPYRLAADGPAHDGTLWGYEPGRLRLAEGALRLRASAGRLSQAAATGGNSQLNALGVALDAREPLVLEAALGPLPDVVETGQAVGLYFGLDQRNFVTVAAVGTGLGYDLHVAYELLDQDARLTPLAREALPIGSRVKLRLSLDPDRRTVTAEAETEAERGWRRLRSIGVDGTFFEGVLPSPEAREPSSFGGLFATGNGARFAFDSFSVRSDGLQGRARPRVLNVWPGDGAGGVSPRAGVVAERLHLPNGGIDPETLSDASVRLLRLPDRTPVPSTVNTSGGFDLLTLQPLAPLEPHTLYVFQVTDALGDAGGARFRRFESVFRTGEAVHPPPGPVAFSATPLALTRDEPVTSLLLLPGAPPVLLAATLDGRLLRLPLQADGTPSEKRVIDALVRHEGGPRLVAGLALDPGSPPEAPVLYLTHSAFDPAFRPLPDWTGKISRLTGPDLAQVEDVVVGLPRSTLDHVTNGLAFGPDGALYVCQGGNTGAGAAHESWGARPERLLSAAILRLDPERLGPLPLDVRTGEAGSYDPYAAEAPLTLFATGVRNAYDLVWHSNGRLYVPINGTNGSPVPASVPGSRRPDGSAYSGPPVPALDRTHPQPDVLVQAEAGGYYGHPNPARGEFVMNGGNPTPGAGNDPGEVAEYPGGTAPDPNYRGAVHDFGRHRSPNGILEYLSDAFGGALRGKLLVARYSRGDDVVVLSLGAGGAVVEELEGFRGLVGFADPLDIVENPATGDLYLAEMSRDPNGPRRITLLRPRR